VARNALQVIRAALNRFFWGEGHVAARRSPARVASPHRSTENNDRPPKVSISYLEIYNEVGYDLLDPAREVAALEHMPQVFFQEDEEGRLHLRNLSAHRAATEEDALNLVGWAFQLLGSNFRALQLFPAWTGALSTSLLHSICS
jgi:hypothetical protein